MSFNSIKSQQKSEFIEICWRVKITTINVKSQNLKNEIICVYLGYL
jgi:hypothetical protein